MSTTINERFLAAFPAYVDRIVDAADANGNGYITLREAKNLGDLEDDFLAFRKTFKTSDPNRFKKFIKDYAQFQLGAGGSTLSNNLAAFQAYEWDVDNGHLTQADWWDILEAISDDPWDIAHGDFDYQLQDAGITSRGLYRTQVPDIVKDFVDAEFKAYVASQKDHYTDYENMTDAEFADFADEHLYDDWDPKVEVLEVEEKDIPVAYIVNYNFGNGKSECYTEGLYMLKYDGTIIGGDSNESCA